MLPNVSFISMVIKKVFLSVSIATISKLNKSVIHKGPDSFVSLRSLVGSEVANTYVTLPFKIPETLNAKSKVRNET